MDNSNLSRADKSTCSSTMHLWSRSAFVVVFCAMASPATAHGQETAQFFRQNCASCHTIGGGPLTGPDLKNVTQRQEREWLVNFIVNPTAVLNSGDAYAMKLKNQARGALMPAVPGMTRERADALLQLIENESALDESQFKGIAVSTEPYTERDIEAGQQYVLGERKLENGGPACIGCHAIQGTGLLGGGRLGPDLTRVYQRLGQDAPRKNLTAWLSAPATTTMAPLFKDHSLTGDEIQSLVAFFEHTAQRDGEEDASGSLAFLILGVIVAVGGLMGMDAIWRNRFRDVRRTLVAMGRKPAREGESVRR